MPAKVSYDEAWTILDIAKAAEIEISEVCAGSPPTDCEIGEEATADWYLVRTHHGRDLDALRWLARRRFGVFQPLQQRRLKNSGGRLVQGMEPVFPGWLFVFCWDARKMRSRIEAVPGVMKVLCFPETDRPVPISEEFVERLRALSWIYDERAPRAGHAAVSGARHRRRLRRCKNIRKLTRLAQHLKKELKARGRFDQTTWQQAQSLNAVERVSLLKRALNAPLP